MRVLSAPRGRPQLLVCGLPGSGYVGKLAADHLVEALGATKVAEFSCESFPPQVNVREDGTAGPLKAQLFHSPRGRGVLIFTADAQPLTSAGEYELSDAVVAYAKKLGARRVYTLAAYITGSFTAEPKVYGAATSKEMAKALESHGVSLMRDGGISGMNGVLAGMASLRGMQAACLLGETSGYLVDAGASKAVLESLSKLTGVRVDTRKLKERAEETKSAMAQIQSMAEQAREGAPRPGREQRPQYIG